MVEEVGTEVVGKTAVVEVGVKVLRSGVTTKPTTKPVTPRIWPQDHDIGSSSRPDRLSRFTFVQNSTGLFHFNFSGSKRTRYWRVFSSPMTMNTAIRTAQLSRT